jgi:dTDP-4-amino-4,6-dideoxygalactose transaminase
MGHSMTVPFLDLKRQYATIREEVERAVGAVLESQQFILGPEVERLEQEIAALCGTRHGIGVASGTDALMLALQAVGVKAGDAVLTSAFSFFATASSITRLGARPVFADIEEETFNIDPSSVEAAAVPETSAIMPVHIFGQCAAVETIREAVASATGRQAAVVEDAAQAIGAARNGRPAGSLGDAGCLSFYPTKNLGGAGDGGMVVTNDERIALRVKRLRAHGDVGRYDHREVGMNSRLDSLQAAILRVKAARLADWNDARRARAREYASLLADVGGDLRLPRVAEGNVHTYHQYVIRTRRRDALAEFLAGRGIGSAIYYPTPLHLQPCFASLGYRAGDLPRTEAACREVLALPLYPELSAQEQQSVASAIREFFRTGH